MCSVLFQPNKNHLFQNLNAVCYYGNGCEGVWGGVLLRQILFVHLKGKKKEDIVTDEVSHSLSISHSKTTLGIERNQLVVMLLSSFGKSEK